MSEIKINLFGIPCAFKNGVKVIFPFKKAEAMLYYVLIEKQVTRDQLTGLLWPDVEEEVSRKNVRNALYNIKKAFSEEILISQKKSLITLNKSLSVYIDVEEFLQSDKIEIYKGDFLQGFALKNDEIFEEWLYRKREYFKEIYKKRLNKKIEEYASDRSKEEIEDYAKKIIELDEFDENAYRILMEFYFNKGDYNKAIEIFQRLTKQLEKDLGVAPEGKTKELFKKIVSHKNVFAASAYREEEHFFYGREKEMDTCQNNFDRFLANKSYKSLLLMGEAGIGKTRLIEEFLQKTKPQDCFIFSSNCYYVEESYPFKPWNVVLSKMSQLIKTNAGIESPLTSWTDLILKESPMNAHAVFHSIGSLEENAALQMQVMEHTIIHMIQELRKEKKILLAFDDIQWMDPLSLSLLNSILLHQEGDLFLVCSCRNEVQRKTTEFIASLMQYHKLDKICIERFTRNQTDEFVVQALHNKNVSTELKDKIYTETEGNTFFLVEFLNSIKEGTNSYALSSKMQDILNSRFLGLSEDGKKIINLLSLFFDGATLDMLSALSSRDELEILNEIEELEKKYILYEVKGKSSLRFQFTHQKLREFVYGQLSYSRKKILHEKVARYLEEKLSNTEKDIELYSKLIYHYSSANHTLAELKYRIKYSNVYLDLNHELFPVLHFLDQKKYVYLTKNETIRHFEKIEFLFEEVKEKDFSKEISELQMEYFHMKGRFLIREGEYEEGISYIENMIETALSLKYLEFALKGYRQMIYYCIQTYAVKKMNVYTQQAMEIAKEVNNLEELAILLRLTGLYHLMRQSYEEAELLLKQSISTFKSISNWERKYVIHIAAAYAYLGDIRRYNKQFSSSIELYNKAIKLCQEKSVTISLSTFTTSAGQAAFEDGNLSLAKEYFNQALETYAIRDFPWGRSIAYGYMCLILLMENKVGEALQALKQAELFSDKVKSPYAMGLLYRIKATVRLWMERDQRLYKAFCGTLKENVEVYCDKGIYYLQKVNGSYEIDILRKLKLEKKV